MRKMRREVTGKVWIVRMLPSVSGLERDRRRGWGRSFTSAELIKGVNPRKEMHPCGDGKRFIVRADDKLTAFVELETAIHEFAVDAMS